MKKSMFVFCLTAAVGVALPSYGDTYTSASYVQDGLVAQWDAIDNTGIGVHDPSSTIWKDLTGNGRDLTLMSGGSWTNGTALNVAGAAAKGAAPAPAYKTIEVLYKMKSGNIVFYSGIDNKHYVLFTGTKGYFQLEFAKDEMKDLFADVPFLSIEEVGDGKDGKAARLL